MTARRREPIVMWLAEHRRSLALDHQRDEGAGAVQRDRASRGELHARGRTADHRRGDLCPNREEELDRSVAFGSSGGAATISLTGTGI